MKIDIQSKTIVLTNALKSHAEQKLKSSMSAYGTHLKEVVIRLSEIKRSRGGKDKLCHIQAICVHSGMPDVIVNSSEKDMYLAIDKATHLLAN